MVCYHMFFFLIIYAQLLWLSVTVVTVVITRDFIYQSGNFKLFWSCCCNLMTQSLWWNYTANFLIWVTKKMRVKIVHKRGYAMKTNQPVHLNHWRTIVASFVASRRRMNVHVCLYCFFLLFSLPLVNASSSLMQPIKKKQRHSNLLITVLLKFAKIVWQYQRKSFYQYANKWLVPAWIYDCS